MAIRWPETVVRDPALENWFENHLFNDDGLFNPSVFEAGANLYECEFAGSLLEVLVFGNSKPAPFSRDALNRAVMLACEQSGYHPDAWWFHVNVHDGVARVVERIGEYSFRYPLEPLMILMSYHAADEGGPTYAGLLDRGKRWCLLLEDSGGFKISMHGAHAFCEAVRETLGGAAAG